MAPSHRSAPGMLDIQRKRKRRSCKEIPIICYLARVLLQNHRLFCPGFKLLVRKSMESPKTKHQLPSSLPSAHCLFQSLRFLSLSLMRNHFLRKLLGFHWHQSGKRQERKEHGQEREEIPVFFFCCQREKKMKYAKIRFLLELTLCTETNFISFVKCSMAWVLLRTGENNLLLRRYYHAASL